ncbi:leucine-rich repeat receptor-like serine/threonine-protein kinase BAM3 [Cornus florida]|uniref:leucine-rich repeat receptor-like serine/threonine-protein kinase BAM3 n=1 Tax=Cornus florida TaxID=4283 RepID=UPI00289AD0D3|nr:leucine-rich repeat receptor-like serine/threonine-protein kinase BAM3 [Cornus florida]
MASISATFLLFFFTLSMPFSLILSATLVEDLNSLKPPPDFNTTLTNNCHNKPSLKYCTTTPFDLPEIFKSTIVASHLCNESKNPNCIESFLKIDLRSRPKIAPLYLSFTFFWKYCPIDILSIDLSNNSLKGNFPSDIFHCSQIQALDLSHNDLSGDVPVQNFSLLTNLTSLNLSYNHFSESKISDTQFFKRFNSSSFLHSGLLPDHGKFRIKAIFFLFGFPIFVIVMVVFLGWLCLWRPDFLPRMLRRKHKFTPAMLKAATHNFSKKNLVGKSEATSIYKGEVRDGTEVRIETYWDSISRENRRKFVEECRILVQLSHRNLVRVLGWCDHRRLRAIVTEWIDAENLEMWLQRSAPPWKQRVKVLMGIVEAMCYLHEEWPELGFDLKTNSILLSEDRQPLISRFRLEDQDSSIKKIYKFGVFSMEMVVNRRPRDEFERGEAGFVEWVRMQHAGSVLNLIDERMKKTGHTIDQATEVIGLGLMCTDISSGRQPSLGHISKMITRIYNAGLVSATKSHKKSNGDKGEHRRIRSR